jgi:hypothetical protein
MAMPATASAASRTRGEVLAAWLADSAVLSELARLHEVEVVAFAESPSSIARLGANRQPAADDSAATASPSPASATDLATEQSAKLASLSDALSPRGKQSQLGTALADTLKKYRTLPLAGVVLLSDGGQNAGPDPVALAESCRAAGVLLHTVGFGPTTAPPNVAVREVLAPTRAFPGDDISLTALVQVQSLVGQQISVVLLKRPADADDSASELIAAQTIDVVDDQQLTTLRYETRVDVPGSYDFEVRVEPIAGEQQVDDNSRVIRIEIIEQQTRVLLYAGAAGRDYQFLRNQLRRDKSFTVDVLLDTGSAGVSQDANTVLAEFPSTAEQLFAYDAIVAFDPQWSKLDASRLALLERWVSKQSGGLVVIPGPVNTSSFGSEAMPRALRDLFPVRVAERWQAMPANLRERDKPQKLVFMREGLDSEFLWLADDAEQSLESWSDFAGVYGAQQVGDPKPGATVYATATDDMAAGSEGMPYLVGHYFGSGQVFYIGSSETWRLRAVDTDYFDLFWTKLLRHVSQGRLLSGSQLAKLLVGQDRYQVGETIDVRAIVADLSLEPLVAPSVELLVVEPSGATAKVALLADDEPGNFAGDLRVRQAGEYRLALPVPNSDERIERTVQVVFPQLEVQQTTQNVALLQRLAEATSGHYYRDIPQAESGDDSLPPLGRAIPSREETRVVPGTVDLDYSRALSGVLMAVIATALACEWITRRLSYLA